MGKPGSDGYDSGSSPDTSTVKCEHCDESIKGHRWGKIKAGDAGWFFTRDGKAYCPKHTPEWVAAWRVGRQ